MSDLITIESKRVEAMGALKAARERLREIRQEAEKLEERIQAESDVIDSLERQAADVFARARSVGVPPPAYEVGSGVEPETEETQTAAF